MSDFNPTLALQLAAQCEEDDERSTPRPWRAANGKGSACVRADDPKVACAIYLNVRTVEASNKVAVTGLSTGSQVLYSGISVGEVRAHLGALGAVANRPPGYRGGTIESKTNFFASGVGPVLKAVSIPLHVGRTTSVWQTTISNADGSMVAMVREPEAATSRPGAPSANSPTNSSARLPLARWWSAPPRWCASWWTTPWMPAPPR